jgi:DNA polymerase-3 subunit alpha
MRNVTREVRPNTLEDIIVIVALYRPGPMQDIPKYVASKHGREEPERLHELINPIVRDTHGVIVYQEQVMQIAQAFAGFSMAEADLLRRAMGKKIKAEMDAMRERFIQGALAKGVTMERAAHVYEVCARFAGYGFNKAHSAGYGLIAYQTAYLKANHPVEFLAASMTIDHGNTDKLGAFRQEAKRMGIAVLGPDINRSDVEFSVEDAAQGTTGGATGGPANGAAIRYALAAVRNVGAHAMKSVVEERARRGAFKSLADFADRLDPKAANRRQIENLALAGAFDTLEPERARVHAGVETILRNANSASVEREAGQANLFAGGMAGADRRFALPAADPWSTMERLKREREALGLYLSAHPLEAYAGVLAAKRVTSAADIASKLAGGATSLQLAGTVERRTERRSARGNRFAHVSFSDPSGDFEVTFFSEVLGAAKQLLEAGTSVLVTAEASNVNDTVRLTAQSIQSLDEVAAKHAAGLCVWLDGPEPVADIRRILSQGNGAKGLGRAKVAIVVRQPLGGCEVEITLPGRFALTPAVREAIARTPGVADLREV